MKTYHFETRFNPGYAVNLSTSLYALRTNQGYGLLHWFEGHVAGSAYLIYHTQISDLTEQNINEALTGDYYYQKISDCLTGLQFYMKILKENKGVEYDIFKLDKREDLFKKCHINCFLTYLGEYRLPPDAQRPPYFKTLELYYYTGKHEWAIFDSIEERYVYDGKKPKLYKKATPEIASYPGYGLEYLSEMLRRFNVNFTLSDFNDEYAEYLLEKRYQKEPYLRPSKEKYDDVKKPLPTMRWREFEDVDDEYLKFCDAVECALDEFISSIDANRKAVNKPLCALLRKLNKINATHPIDSLEQEELYDYIVKILQTLRKAQLIEKIDNNREW